MFTPTDIAELAAIGIHAEPSAATRPAFAIERILQAAVEHAVVWWDRYDDQDEVRYLNAQIDGRPVTEPEYRAIVDLLDSGYVALGNAGILRITDRGQSLLNRWSAYIPLRGDQR